MADNDPLAQFGTDGDPGQDMPSAANASLFELGERGPDIEDDHEEGGLPRHPSYPNAKIHFNTSAKASNDAQYEWVRVADRPDQEIGDAQIPGGPSYEYRRVKSEPKTVPGKNPSQSDDPLTNILMVNFLQKWPEDAVGRLDALNSAAPHTTIYSMKALLAHNEHALLIAAAQNGDTAMVKRMAELYGEHDLDIMDGLDGAYKHGPLVSAAKNGYKDTVYAILELYNKSPDRTDNRYDTSNYKDLKKDLNGVDYFSRNTLSVIKEAMAEFEDSSSVKEPEVTNPAASTPPAPTKTVDPATPAGIAPKAKTPGQGAYDKTFEEAQTVLINHLGKLGLGQDIKADTIGNYTTGKPDGILGKGSTAALKELAMKADPDCDGTYSAKTAQNIVNYMIARGVPSDQATAFGTALLALIDTGPKGYFAQRYAPGVEHKTVAPKPQTTEKNTGNTAETTKDSKPGLASVDYTTARLKLIEIEKEIGDETLNRGAPGPVKKLHKLADELKKTGYKLKPGQNPEADKIINQAVQILSADGTIQTINAYLEANPKPAEPIAPTVATAPAEPLTGAIGPQRKPAGVNFNDHTRLNAFLTKLENGYLEHIQGGDYSDGFKAFVRGIDPGNTTLLQSSIDAFKTTGNYADALKFAITEGTVEDIALFNDLRNGTIDLSGTPNLIRSTLEEHDIFAHAIQHGDAKQISAVGTLYEKEGLNVASMLYNGGHKLLLETAAAPKAGSLDRLIEVYAQTQNSKGTNMLVELEAGLGHTLFGTGEQETTRKTIQNAIDQYQEGNPDFKVGTLPVNNALGYANAKPATQTAFLDKLSANEEKISNSPLYSDRFKDLIENPRAPATSEELGDAFQFAFKEGNLGDVAYVYSLLKTPGGDIDKSKLAATLQSGNHDLLWDVLKSGEHLHIAIVQGLYKEAGFDQAELDEIVKVGPGTSPTIAATASTIKPYAGTDPDISGLGSEIIGSFSRAVGDPEELASGNTNAIEIGAAGLMVVEAARRGYNHVQEGRLRKLADEARTEAETHRTAQKTHEHDAAQKLDEADQAGRQTRIAKQESDVAQRNAQKRFTFNRAQKEAEAEATDKEYKAKKSTEQRLRAEVKDSITGAKVEGAAGEEAEARARKLDAQADNKRAKARGLNPFSQKGKNEAKTAENEEQAAHQKHEQSLQEKSTTANNVQQAQANEAQSHQEATDARARADALKIKLPGWVGKVATLFGTGAAIYSSSGDDLLDIYEDNDGLYASTIVAVTEGNTLRAVSEASGETAGILAGIAAGGKAGLMAGAATGNPKIAAVTTVVGGVAGGIGGEAAVSEALGAVKEAETNITDTLVDWFNPEANKIAEKAVAPVTFNKAATGPVTIGPEAPKTSGTEEKKGAAPKPKNPEIGDPRT